MISCGQLVDEYFLAALIPVVQLGKDDITWRNKRILSGHQLDLDPHGNLNSVKHFKHELFQFTDPSDHVA